ncbi:MAG: hypothetical protein M1829_004729 [Trizodia sp. TS-e1964]|nr:MAG: hypothetical protein M1829_004729 [Trizodia sp. TS-e1964]
MKLGNPREVGCLDNGGSVFPPTPQDPLELSYCGDFEAKTVKRRIEGVDKIPRNNKIESHLVIINHSFKSMYDPTPDLPKPQIYCQLPNNRGRLECLKSKDPLAPSHMEWRPPINGIRLEHLHAIQADSPLFHIRKNVFEVNELFASEAWDKGEYYIVCAKHLYDLIDSDLRKLNLKPADGKKFEYSDTDLN